MSAHKAWNPVCELWKHNSGKPCAASSRPGQFKIWSKVLPLNKVVPSEKEKQGHFSVFELGPEQESERRYFLLWKTQPKGVTGADRLFKIQLDNVVAVGAI